MALTRREVEESMLGDFAKCLEKATDSKPGVIGTCMGEVIYQFTYIDPDDDTATIEKPKSVNAYFNGDQVAQAVADGLVDATFPAQLVKIIERFRIGRHE